MRRDVRHAAAAPRRRTLAARNRDPPVHETDTELDHVLDGRNGELAQRLITLTGGDTRAIEFRVRERNRGPSWSTRSAGRKARRPIGAPRTAKETRSSLRERGAARTQASQFRSARARGWSGPPTKGRVSSFDVAVLESRQPRRRALVAVAVLAATSFKRPSPARRRKRRLVAQSRSAPRSPMRGSTAPRAHPTGAQDPLSALRLLCWTRARRPATCSRPPPRSCVRGEQ